jgi:hypothetical protein
VPRLPTLLPADLERRLLHKGVRDLAAGRDRCGECRRTPLPGEHLDRYEDGARLCELCSALRRGVPVESRRVRHPEHGHAVKLTIRAA